jgi:argininosuccinate synthase
MEAFELTADPADAPDPVEVVIGFAQGLPVELDGEELELVDLIADLNERAGAYGIGRIDMIENRAVGIKSRELYEAPAALVVIEAHRALEDIVLTRAELHEKRRLEDRWATLVYEGHWFSPLREAMDAFVDSTQEPVEGEVRVRLAAGSATVVGRRSPQALYTESLASYGAGEVFPHAAAEGFVLIAALEAELAAARSRKRATV